MPRDVVAKPFIVALILILGACNDGGNSGNALFNESFEVSLQVGEGGTLDKTDAIVGAGTFVDFTISPDTGYAVASATGCNGQLSGNIYRTGAITTDCQVAVTFSNEASAVTLDYEPIKVFSFTWEDTIDATHYVLMENQDGSSGFTQIGEDIPADTESYQHIVPLHTRTNAQYFLQTCFAYGCNDSAVVNVEGSLLGSIGRIDPDRLSPSFGQTVTMSADGNTLAVASPNDQLETMDVECDPVSPIPLAGSGSVYVFTRNGSVWAQQAVLQPSNPCEVRFGRSISISADGNRLAVGTSGTRIANEFMGFRDLPEEFAGDVYVFQRNGTHWQLDAALRASNPDSHDGFGQSVELSADGNTLAVSAPRERSAASGVNGDQNDNSGFAVGAVYVFERLENTWVEQAYLKSGAEIIDRRFFGFQLGLSGQGDTLVASGISEFFVFERSGEQWRQTAIESLNGFASAIDIDFSGDVIIAGDSARPGGGVAYLYTRVNGDWSQQATIIASNADANDRFGERVAVSADGMTLLIGATVEAGNARGLAGDESDNSLSVAGAAYVFQSKGGSWIQQAYVKSRDTAARDFFGRSLSLSGDGTTLVVGGGGVYLY